MINQKVETEASFSNNYAKSESVAGKKKLKKVRSIRLLRFPSMRSSSGGRRSQYENLYMLSSVATETSNQPTPIQMSDSSPNYMKGTSSSHAKESFQITERLITKKTLTRVSTLKLMRNVTRKLSGRTELKRKLKPSRSIKLATVKGQKSTRNQSELIHGRDGQSWKRTGDIQPHSTNAGNKSQRVITRRLSLKPVRILTKMPTFKSKNDSSLNKATCSSTLKDSHFPDHIDLPQEESASQGVPAMKVCPYSYCSLHGHRHNNLPPLKRFVSMRRRLLKTQKSMKIDGRPVARSKQSGDRRKATQKARTVHNGASISHFQNAKKLARDSCIWLHDTPESTVTEGGTSGGEDEENYNFRCDAEVLLGETSSPHMINFEEFRNSLAEKGHTYLAIKETDTECCCIATERDKSDSKVTETAGDDKNIAACKKNDESDIVESTSIDVVKSSASDVEILEGEANTKCKNMEQDYEVLQMSSAQKEREPACTTDVAYRMQERDHKYVRMWHLMYKHAMLSNTGKEKHKLPFDGRDKKGREQDSQSFDVVSSSSFQDYCEADQDMGDENKNVIELVQKAFDEILLPEPEGLSSDDDCKSSGIGSEEVLLEKSEGNRGEQNTSASSESPKEETWLKVDNFRRHVDEITAQQMGTKPDHKTPKRWSNLKKLILLKRFVKALEKVRNFSLQRPRHLPSDANLEAEKVFLRHQTAEEKKNAEEWMLDYALQKVISRLAPAQRQRVALLVEAFESILPFQDAENVLQSSATAETQANPAQSIDYPSDHSKEETDKGRDYGYSDKMLIGKASCSHNSVMEFADNASDNPMPELHNPMVFSERCLDQPVTNALEIRPASGIIDEYLNQRQSLASNCDNGEKISTDKDNIHLAEIKDSRSWSSSKPAEIMGSCHEEAPTNEIINEVPDDLISISNTEIPDSKSESPGRDFESENLIGADREQFSMTKSLILKGLARSLGSDLVGSEAPSDLLDQPTADRKERIEKTRLETGTLKGFPTDEQSEAPESVVVEPETRIEKQNYTGLWYLVYKHMASDIAETDSKTLIDGADEKESGYGGSITRGTSVSYESTPAMNQDMHFKDHGVADPEVQLQQIEAIKMVEEAIDSILPDAQDDLLDRQSLKDNTIISNCSKQSNRTERVYSEDLNQKEEKMASGNGITQEEEQEEPAPKEGNKSNQQLPRSWSNLKKVILLRRFIKALEKVRKFNPRGPRYLPIEPDSEAEKVNLRHQDMAERKGTEEWMLDYALRQVVSKLTPARKRKVELLVEAFETVTPTLKN